MSENVAPLQYEAASLSREPMDGGGVRLTIVSRRRPFMQKGLILMAALVAATATAYFLAPPRLQMRIALLGVGGAAMWLLFFLVILTQPREYTSVFEAGPFGLRVQTVVGGDPIRRTFARAEIQEINTAGPLIVVSRGQQHAYLHLESPQRLREVAEALREAIG